MLEQLVYISCRKVIILVGTIRAQGTRQFIERSIYVLFARSLHFDLSCEANGVLLRSQYFRSVASA